MNKQEAIDFLKKDKYTVPFDAAELNYNKALDKAIDIVNQIDEPEKPVVPQFVADWIEEGKKTCKDVQDLFIFNFNSEEVKRWFLDYKPFDLVARAWLDGYEVEQKKRYRIKMKNEEYNHTVVIGDYTREEIEATGFGWVFDCEGVEVQEVE